MSMSMSITIKTELGMQFTFNEVDGKKYVVKNCLEKGILARTVKMIKGEPFEVRVHEIDYVDFKPREEITVWQSNSPVAKIEIG